MDPFPFSDDEWDRVKEASRAVVNATLADDLVVRASHFIVLQIVLDELRLQHGEHPVLLETEADFEDEPLRRFHLYRCAIQLAERNRLPTYTIRISLARLLLEDFNDMESAENELESCRDEIVVTGDDAERNEWWDLLQLCRPQNG